MLLASNKWQKSPDLQCTLSCAKCVVDDVSQTCFVIGGIRGGVHSSKVSLFEPEKGLIDIHVQIDKERYYHEAVLM